MSIQVLKMKVKGEGCRPSVQVEKNGFHFKASSKCISFFFASVSNNFKSKDTQYSRVFIRPCDRLFHTDMKIV